MEGTSPTGIVVISLEDKEMDKLKKELEVLKSWGIESIPVDKVLSMIEEMEDTGSESEEKSVINIYYPPCPREDGVDKYFREIPMYVASGRTFNRGDLLSSAREVWYT